MHKFDFLIIGAGLYGCTCAQQLTEAGRECLVIEKKDHIAGNIYTKEIEGIQVHCYGGHIFHTNDKNIWDYVNRFASFNNFINSPIANYKGEIYNLPFNMNTFYQMWGVVTPQQAQEKIQQQVAEAKITSPTNLEEQAISLVGTDIYQKLVKGYTEKQWGKPCSELPPFIIKKLPVRFTYDNNYFNDRYQGIPECGYTEMIRKMLDGIDIQLSTDYFENRKISKMAKRIIYTGPIDAYFEYKYGYLEWRSLRFDTQVFDCPNYQGVAAVNYTDAETPFTRIIEHKHFAFGNQQKTIITWEYPIKWQPGMEAYYPINDIENNAKYEQYRALANKEENATFGGRLATYQYLDMDKIISGALHLSSELLKNE